MNPSCFDNNPATWHLAVVNQIGYKKSTFIMDSANNEEVWNHPLRSYRYSYYNPRTQRPVASLHEAMVAREQFPEDRFAPYRATNAKYIVGIDMIVNRADENPARKRDYDYEIYDFNSDMRLKYDLELDEQGVIVGGEWHSDKFPDFLWRPVPGVFPRSVGDSELDQLAEQSVWNSNEMVPAFWLDAASKAANNSQPLARIVESLIRFSNQ
jgi:hypothetical protein